MPSGRTHDRITLWTLPVVAGTSLAIAQNSSLTLLVCGGFLFGGLMCGPDLDVHSVHYKRWGYLRWIWIPYRGSMRHRSPLSHSPITGTVLRTTYLVVWVGIFVLVGLTALNQLWQIGWTWHDIGTMMGRSLARYHQQGLAVIVGLELGALSHYLADWLVSGRKRFKTKGWAAFQPRPLKPKRKSTTKRRPKAVNSAATKRPNKH